MKKYKLVTNYRKMLADTLTPVSIYLRLRDKYVNTIMLESSDYHAKENSFSYICFDPIASFQLQKEGLSLTFPDGSTVNKIVEDRKEVVTTLTDFSNAFANEENDFDFISNGLFGYMGYGAVEFFEDIDLQKRTDNEDAIPEILYKVYRYVIAINHFKNELHLFEHNIPEQESEIDKALALITSKNHPDYSFQVTGEETSNLTNDEFLETLAKGKEHCQLGDVFQIVLSRRFESKFKGDEFNVYRTLRSVNPSPYLFYFDYGNFKIFGSSPEAQIVVKNNQATIHPIAGTFKRTGDDKADRELAKQLYDDPKENAEHIMLVDLARNDLSRDCEAVTVETFKEIQYYSHVIHLVSKVTGKFKEAPPIKIVADTFPAGTLSGAPKHMAMQLIDKYETTHRGFYGGAIGFLGFNGDFNHAIMIRSFMSKDNRLHYQAGAGVVSKSDINSELQEVNNKLGALRQAIKMAENI